MKYPLAADPLPRAVVLICILHIKNNCVRKFFMQHYRIDELRPLEYDKIKSYFDEHFSFSDLGDLYWIPIDDALLTDIQASHTECQPFFFAVELEETSISFELLVRTKARIRCDCIGYATEAQRNWLIRLADSIFEQLDIIT